MGSSKMLYNGIALPDVWPPRRTVEDLRKLEPMPVPYLEHPPEIVPIDLGRQLFVDDFLVAHTTLKRSFYCADYIDGNPVLKPEKRWEGLSESPSAMTFSDGVFYDPQERIFKMWYRAGRNTCYAISHDGIVWERPALDFMPGSNIVCLSATRDSSTVWMDFDEKNPEKRYKMFAFHRDPWRSSIYHSADGLHWHMDGWTGTTGDRSTMFYNPFRKVWVYSIRDHFKRAGATAYPGNPLGRCRRYREHPDFVAGAAWTDEETPWWVGADNLDKPRADVPDIQPELYNLDAVAYESILLGLFSIWRHHPAGRPKINEVFLGFSRDGFHWHRPHREAVCPVSEEAGAWNWCNVQSAGGGCLIVGDKLHFYVSGRTQAQNRAGRSVEVQSTGLATMRRDGFASMDADGAGGQLTTRPVRFSGQYLFVNADVPHGELRVEILDEAEQVIAPFNRENCIPIRADGTLQAISWKGASDFSSLAGRPVKFRFCLTNGRLYAFWVSSDPAGASGGYVAAGGPGFSGNRDIA